MPSPESCYKRCEVSLPCNTDSCLNCTRVCMSDRKGKTGLRLWRSRAATFGYPGFDLFGVRRHLADSDFRSAGHANLNLGTSVSLNVSRACYKAPLDRGTRYQQQMFGRLWLAHRLS